MDKKGLKIMMKMLKKNQIIIFVIALMLVSAGYLNYTSLHADNTIATSVQTNSILEMAGIGDAQLVSSNHVVEENAIQEEEQKQVNEVVNTNAQTNTITANSNQAEEETKTKETEYFTASKLSRDTMYSQMLESYQKILENAEIPESQKTIAQNEIKNINTTRNAIMISENLIQNKGFENVLIFMNSDSANVIVEADELTTEQIAQIQNIVTRELNVKIENVHISQK